MTTIRSVGIVGAGTMGLGIAQVCAARGFQTLIYDAVPTQAEKAVLTIARNLDEVVTKGKMTVEERDQALSRLRTARSMDELTVDLVIEAAVERLDVKQELFGQLERINSGRAILATNTSSLSVAKVAERLTDPSRCIGLHFFNPAERMKLVEIISGPATRPEIREALQKFSSTLQKTAVLAKDSPGFIVNRVARPYYAEALTLLEKGAATVDAIDQLMRASGFRMGPFELMDLIGVDTNLAVTTSVYEGLGRPSKFRPSRIQQQLVSEGRYGRKSGDGFYAYTGKKVS